MFAAALGTATGAASDSDAGDALWLGFLATLAQATGASAALLRIEQHGRVKELWQHGTPVPLSAAQSLQMRSDRVYSETDLPAEPGPKPYARALKSALGQGEFAALALQRDDRDFRAVDGLQLSNLTPFLPQALLGWRRLRDERLGAARDLGMLRRLGAGWIRFTPAGNILDLSVTAQELIAATPRLRRRSDGWLEFPDSATAQAFQTALLAAQSGEENGRVLAISQDPPLELVFHAGAAQDGGALTAYLRGPRPARALPLAQIAASLGLSRSEARLVQLLCDGFSLQDAATELGWTAETARSASKRIYARMGASGQSAVIRAVLTSAIWLA
ncbi:helix-turn-helix transcriptional regulator [Paracoccus aminophilus]|uniref:Transcriptional regulator, LuxR family n=1 Tax=Paracoccus aminophilus JCM 7686 TaxID=1367847 RepID=S5YIR8_PARAH|nr:transcriptional regulator, LuxR family [Paracoccus aminophilus]AGT11368.1 transcriptional regulator, LuxR family [Paracoccus aminophilus JCM 7686]